jgi:hypothetical protein
MLLAIMLIFKLPEQVDRDVLVLLGKLCASANARGGRLVHLAGNAVAELPWKPEIAADINIIHRT